MHRRVASPTRLEKSNAPSGLLLPRVPDHNLLLYVSSNKLKDPMNVSAIRFWSPQTSSPSLLSPKRWPRFGQPNSIIFCLSVLLDKGRELTNQVSNGRAAVPTDELYLDGYNTQCLSLRVNHVMTQS
ncbi:hypothetical protein BaRGS_00038335 [Batillaria attramentaria]|uniref:Uncharacterized protein n=1 Tax=Batillaria attramentaria TaxID=370345 RepID=A0ABD0J6M0_9CAEN